MKPPLGATESALGRRRDRCCQAHVGLGNIPGPGRTRPLNAIDQRQSEPVSVNGHGRTAGWARPLERSRRVAGRIRLGCWAGRQSGRPKLGSTGLHHVSPFNRAEGWLQAGQFRPGRDDSRLKGQTPNSYFPGRNLDTRKFTPRENSLCVVSRFPKSR